MRHHSKTALAALTIAALFVPGTSAHATTVNRCLAKKIANVGASLSRRARCYAKNAAKPDAETLASCLEKASAKFTGNGTPGRGLFGVPEQQPPCVTVGDQSAFDATIADYAGALDVQVGNPGAPNRCDAAKLKCVGKYGNAIARCSARAANGAGVVNDDCVAKAISKLANGASGYLDKAAASGVDCSVSGDVDALAAGADQFVVDALCALDPIGTGGCPNAPATPTPTPTRTPTPTPTNTTAPSGDVAQLCVDRINQYRASIGRPPYARWTAAETCSDDEAASDSVTGQPHGAFGQCGEWAQNECPGWPGPAETMILSCLQVMWNEGPGSDFSQHGHYINMSSQSYTRVACGFAVLPNGAVWSVQNFQ